MGVRVCVHCVCKAHRTGREHVHLFYLYGWYPGARAGTSKMAVNVRDHVLKMVLDLLLHKLLLVQVSSSSLQFTSSAIEEAG